MAEAMVGAIATERNPQSREKCTDVRQLQEGVEWIHQFANDVFEEVITVCKLALTNMETPRGAVDMETAARAFHLIWGKCEQIDSCIRESANDLGCGYVDEDQKRRFAAQNAAQASVPCH